jgi:hypothetical protein
MLFGLLIFAEGANSYHQGLESHDEAFSSYQKEIMKEEPEMNRIYTYLDSMEQSSRNIRDSENVKNVGTGLFYLGIIVCFSSFLFPEKKDPEQVENNLQRHQNHPIYKRNIKRKL